MSNEHHDIAMQRAAEMGFVADHLRAPAAEGLEPAAGLFELLVSNALAGRPTLEECGLRVVIMARRACVPMAVTMTRAQMHAMRRIALDQHDGLRVPVGGRLVYELVAGGEMEPWRIGRRVTLLGYALVRNVVVRDVLPSLEVIGEIWGLRATNKRSAVCAAMNKLRSELVRTGHLPAGFRFWFEKSADARLVYEQVQLGNQNRRGNVRDDEEETEAEPEMEHGVPLRAEWAALRPEERRRKLRRMWEEAELRRLVG